MIPIYTFQDKSYIPLATLLHDIKKTSLDEVFYDYAQFDLCFYYYGAMFYKNEKVTFEGMIQIESDLKSLKHIQASLKLAQTNPSFNWLKPRQKLDGLLEGAYTIGGAITSKNATINNTPTQINRDELYLPNSVLPYYLIPLDMLEEYEYDKKLEKGSLEFILKHSQNKPVSNLSIKLGESLGTPLNPSPIVLKFRLSQQKEATEHANRNYMHKVQHLKDYRGFFEESQKENARLGEQLKALLAEVASFRPKTKNTKQLQREALLEKLLEAMENLALEKAKLDEYEYFRFSRGCIKATREDMQSALKRLEYLETGHGTLFTIELSTFEGFWKKQTLCRLAVGVGQSIDTNMLLDELFCINND